MARSVRVIGHRGAAGLAPENTLASFRRAVELGVDAVECDVRLSRDGRLVVIHDKTVDRTTGGSGAVGRLSFEQIRALDAGAGEVVPTLEEVLEALRGRCELFCELKGAGTERPALEAASAAGMERQVVFVSFRPDRLEALKHLAPDARVGPILVALEDADIRRAAAMGAELVSLRYPSASREAVEMAHESGLQLLVWTPNELAEMQAMIALGVDGITTDRPDLLLHRLEGQGAP